MHALSKYLKIKSKQYTQQCEYMYKLYKPFDINILLFYYFTQLDV